MRKASDNVAAALRLVVLAILLSATLGVLVRPLPPARADTAVSVSISSSVVPLGTTATTDIFVNGVSGPSGLGTYEMSVAFDKSKVKVVSATGDGGFGGSMVSNAGDQPWLSNGTGTLRLAAYQPWMPGPTGNVKVAVIIWKSLAPGIHPLALSVDLLSNSNGDFITGFPVVNGEMTVTGAAAGPGTVNIGGRTTVAITVGGVLSPGLKSYALTVAFNPAKISVSGVDDGDPPFGAPSTKVIDSVAGLVTLGDSLPSGYPVGSVVVARLNIQGVAEGGTDLAVSITSLVDATGSPLDAGVASGAVNVTLPVVKTGSVVINPALSASVAVTAEGLAGQSLKSYQLAISFDRARIKVAGVGDGDAPFGRPATAMIDNTAGAVVLADSVSTEFPTGRVVLAYLQVEGLANGVTGLSVQVVSLTNQAGVPITYGKVEGAVTVSPASVEVGQVFLLKDASVDIPVTVRGVPPLTGGKGGLGSYFFRINFDPAKVRVNRFSSSGADPQFAARLVLASSDNNTGQAFFRQSVTGEAGPTGDVVVAKMNVTALADGDTTLALVDHPDYKLADPSGIPIMATWKSGRVVGVAVEVGSTTAAVNSTARISMTIRFPAGTPGLKSFAATIGFDRSKIRVDSVSGGDAPFGSLTTKKIDNAVGTVLLAGSQTGGTATGNILVAVLNVAALSVTDSRSVGNNASPISVTVSGLTDGSDRVPAGIPGSGSPGGITIVWPNTVRVQSPSMVRGTTADIPIFIEVNELLVPRGLGSYRLRIDFDNTKLVLNSVRGGSSPFNAAPTFERSAGAGSAIISASQPASPGPRGSFTIAYLNVTVKNTAAAGQTGLAATVLSLVDSGGDSVSANAESGVVSIYPSSPPGSGGAPPGLPPPPPVSATAPTLTPTPTPTGSPTPVPGGGSGAARSTTRATRAAGSAANDSISRRRADSNPYSPTGAGPLRPPPGRFRRGFGSSGASSLAPGPACENSGDGLTAGRQPEERRPRPCR
ncbi:MAG: hypothetical protein HY673_08100 [Chloroflexi bacterium]|nr:hypothetical protein [Chloroflexota bacterium]